MLERRSALSDCPSASPEESTLTLAECAVAGAMLLPGWDDSIAEQAAAAGAALGLRANPTAGSAVADSESLLVQLAPHRYLAITAAPAKAAALEAAVDPARRVDWRCARVWLRLCGSGARELVDTAVPVDLRAGVFTAGSVVQSTLAQVDVLLHARGDADAGAAFDLLVGRSFARYLAERLSDAARARGGALRVAPA